MAKKPDERFPTSEAFVGALRQALGLRPTEPHMMPATPSTSRRPLVVLVASMAVVAAVVGIALAFIYGAATEPGAPTIGSIDGGSPPSVAAATDQATEAAEPSPFTLLESSLVLSLPEEAAPDCRRGEGALLPTRQGPSVKPQADVICRLLGGTGPDEIEMWILPPTDFFNGVEVIDGLAAAAQVAEGDCSSQIAASGGWDNAVDQWGGYLCMTAADGAATLYWSRDDARALFRTTESGGDSATLYQWWLDQRESIAP